MKGKRPVFIHSLFRTGSTYLWNKFRQKDNYYCYYEPFHQNLIKVTPSNLENLMTRDFGSVNHPALSKYYLYEYKPLIEDGGTGVTHFKKSFSFDDFCNNKDNPNLKTYIDYLIQGAGDKVPVLQFNRSAFRIKWFNRNYPNALNIYLVRSPHDQWQSYFEVLKKTSYSVFFVMDLMIAGLNKNHEAFKPLAQALPLFQFNNTSFYKEEEFYSLILRCYSDEEKYSLFYYTWLLGFMQNLLYSNFIVNMNLLSSDSQYRKKIMTQFQKFGIEDLDFEDANLKEYTSYHLSPKLLKDIEDRTTPLALSTLNEEHINLFFEKLSADERKYFQFKSTQFRKWKRKRMKPAHPDIAVEKLEKMTLLFSEKYFQNKEVIAFLHGAINNKDISLKKKEEKIEEKDRQLSLKESQIAKKDEQLEQKDALLKRKLNEKDRIIDEKNEGITGKFEELMKILERQEELLANKESELLTQQDLIEEKGRESDQKNRRIKELERKLDEKEEDIRRIYDSSFYRTGKTVLLPFLKIKKMVIGEGNKKRH